jgi:hypothetical protein
VTGSARRKVKDKDLGALADQLRELDVPGQEARSLARMCGGPQFVYPAPAVADILHCHRGVAGRMVTLAHSVFPTTTLDGQPLEPTLPATADALGEWVIDQAHADVIEKVLGGVAAKRLRPEVWSAAEAQLAQ